MSGTRNVWGVRFVRKVWIRMSVVTLGMDEYIANKIIIGRVKFNRFLLFLKFFINIFFGSDYFTRDAPDVIISYKKMI